jgi:hypothetical protein
VVHWRHLLRLEPDEALGEGKEEEDRNECDLEEVTWRLLG